MNQEDYELCERENTNLRNALAWAAKKLSPPEQDALEKVLHRRIAHGGVTGTFKEDRLHEATELLAKLVKHLEPLLLTPPPPSTAHPIWFAGLDTLLEQARAFEPKHPLMRRIGGHPNVFAPVRGPI